MHSEVEGRSDMTRRVLTAIGSVTAVAAAVGTCLLLGPTPQAQADTISGSSGSSSGTITTSPTGFSVTGKSSSGMGSMSLTGGKFCVTGVSGSSSGSFCF